MATFVCRSEHFSACHRLHSGALTDEENRNIYGPCNNPNGHGHNYELTVVVNGEIDPTTGMVINISTLKKLIQDHVLIHLDHRNIDLDVPYFKNRVSTTENVAQFVWVQLEPLLKESLYQVMIRETNKNLVIYRGRNNNTNINLFNA